MAVYRVVADKPLFNEARNLGDRMRRAAIEIDSLAHVVERDVTITDDELVQFVLVERELAQKVRTLADALDSYRKKIVVYVTQQS